jgi:DNA-directed RNA polymerase specialized sigma24 family protein
MALSLRQRAVTVLTYWSDLDPGAIAQLLGISEGFGPPAPRSCPVEA